MEKFQNMKREKFLSDKKEWEDRITEQSLEDQIKELSCLGRQEKYEKYIYDKLILAQNGLIDICQKYLTEVHSCEQYEFISLKLKSDFALCLYTFRKLNEMLEKQKSIGQKLKNTLNKILAPEKYITIKQILSGNDDNAKDEKVLKINHKKEIIISEEKYHKIKINNRTIRSKSSIRINKNNTSLFLDKNVRSDNNKNEIDKNYYNNYY